MYVHIVNIDVYNLAIFAVYLGHLIHEFGALGHSKMKSFCKVK